MTKYEIKTNSFEIAFHRTIPAMTADEIFTEFIAQNTGDHESVEATFVSKEEALKYFSAHYANYGETWERKGWVSRLLIGDVAWIEENVYTDDDELDYTFAVIAYSAQAYNPEEDDESEVSADA